MPLNCLDQWPHELNDVPAVLIQQVLPHPTLIHIPGRWHRPIFVSILLHGDEDVGLKAIQQVLANHRHALLPRALSVFIGNVHAASHAKRTLPSQLDFNRVWPGSELPSGPEHELMREVVSAMVQRRVAASIDLHNNSGRNPYYACVCALEKSHMQLASLFGDKVLYFQQPKGVQTQAFSPICPAITCECGPIGDGGGVRAAVSLLEAVLSLDQEEDLLEQLPPVPEHLELFHTVATWRALPQASIGFDSRKPSDIFLRPDLDCLNFKRLDKGTELGQLTRPLDECLSVTDAHGRNVTKDYFELDAQGNLKLHRDTLPSMLTTSVDALRLDCIGYFMEQLRH